MSSHWDWAKRMSAQHDQERAFAPENGRPLRFKVGDPVIFTNDAGIEYRLHILGFYSQPLEPCGLYAGGARYFLDWECHWFPVCESTLRPV